MALAVMLAMLLAQVTPSPSPSPSECFHDASLTRADYPKDFAPAHETPLYATVSVLVSADGKVEKASIYKSSGDLQFDMASIRAAKSSNFKPKRAYCKAVEGTFFFKTSLTRNP